MARRRILHDDVDIQFQGEFEQLGCKFDQLVVRLEVAPRAVGQRRRPTGVRPRAPPQHAPVLLGVRVRARERRARGAHEDTVPFAGPHLRQRPHARLAREKVVRNGVDERVKLIGARSSPLAGESCKAVEPLAGAREEMGQPVSRRRFRLTHLRGIARAQASVVCSRGRARCDPAAGRSRRAPIKEISRRASKGGVMECPKRGMRCAPEGDFAVCPVGDIRGVCSRGRSECAPERDRSGMAQRCTPGGGDTPAPGLARPHPRPWAKAPQSKKRWSNWGSNPGREACVPGTCPLRHGSFEKPPRPSPVFCHPPRTLSSHTRRRLVCRSATTLVCP